MPFTHPEASRLLFDTMLQGVVFHDGTGRVLAMNPAAVRILGRPTAEIIGRSPAENEQGWLREDGSPLPPAEHPVLVALRTGREVREMIMGIYNPGDPGYRWLSVSTVPLFRPGENAPYQVYAIFDDITERKNAAHALADSERRLRELAVELRAADERKNEFLAVLSHELRNPLTPIKNALYILERAPVGSEQARRAHAAADRQFEQLSRLIDDLLDLTRLTTNQIRLRRSELDAAELAAKTVEDFRAVFENHRVGLRFEAPAAPVWVLADGARLTQALGNLLANAVKFTRYGGEAVVRAATENGLAVLEVRDSGAGMTEETLAGLFTPFHANVRRTGDGRGGPGLGLALVKQIVELHGGTVTAESAGPGLGSTFTLRLPLAAPARAGAVPAEKREAKPRRVLIVEDNVDSAETLAETLKLRGHTVSVAHDGAGGLDAARAFAPEVIFCDIGLPGMDGYEFARTLRADAAFAGVRLVALTGYAQPADKVRAAEAGFDAHLPKPPRLGDLFALLQ